MRLSKIEEIQAQLNLPFRETEEDHLELIFNTLEREFGLKRFSKQKLLDLGAGNGIVIFYAALKWGIRAIGIEINEELVEEMKQKLSALKSQKPKIPRKILKKINIIHGDFYSLNLRPFDFIFIYGLPTMHKFLKHLIVSMKKDAILISHIYPIAIFENLLNLKKEILHKGKTDALKTFLYKKI